MPAVKTLGVEEPKGDSHQPRKWLEAVKDWQMVDALIDMFLDMAL